jgi:hypothetical protein
MLNCSCFKFTLLPPVYLLEGRFLRSFLNSAFRILNLTILIGELNENKWS